jgi:hypothetical protein
MKPEFRHKLAQLPFEEKIRKVGELIRLSQKVKTQRTGDQSASYPQPRRGNSQSLKGTKAMEIFMSERKREREL